MEKIIISFNDKEYNESLKSLQVNLKKLEQCLIYIEQIAGTKELKSLDEIKKIICNKSGFDNVLASAELLNLIQPYIYLENHLDSLNLDVIENDNGTYKLKDTVLYGLKEANTTYLSDVFISDYNTLNKAITQLNKLSNPALTNCLVRDYKGTWSINLIKLQNSNVMV